MANEAPERIWAASVTENYGEWQTTTDGLPRPTEYVRADLVTARCSSCDGTGDVHRADGEWLGECNCGSEFRHAFDVEANPSKAYRVIQSQATRIAALEAKLDEAIRERDEAEILKIAWFECHLAHRDALQAIGKANSELLKRAMDAESRLSALEA